MLSLITPLSVDTKEVRKTQCVLMKCMNDTEARLLAHTNVNKKVASSIFELKQWSNPKKFSNLKQNLRTIGN